MKGMSITSVQFEESHVIDTSITLANWGSYLNHPPSRCWEEKKRSIYSGHCDDNGMYAPLPTAQFFYTYMYTPTSSAVMSSTRARSSKERVEAYF